MEKDLEILCNIALKHGARARVMPASQVVVDARVRLKCLVPRCDSYGHNLMCPPHLPGVDEFTECLERYDFAVIIQVSGDSARYAELARRLHEVVGRVEKQAMEMGYHLSAGFIGGACRLCDECVGPGARCRHPFLARPSMEGMGVNVSSTVAKVGYEVKFPVGDGINWYGMVLVG
ncbi:MAG: DUF2284 domain-containing protein [Bacillota bacterium]